MFGNRVQFEVNGQRDYPDNFLFNQNQKFASALESKVGENAQWTKFQKTYGADIDRGNCRVLNVPGIDPTKTLAQQGVKLERTYVFSNNAYRIMRSREYERIMSSPGGKASVTFLFWMKANGRQ